LNGTVRSDCAWSPDKKCVAFGGWRGTNQALGLNLAMQIFDRSPRRNFTSKPHNIVIVVTDGEDTFPNMTARNATLVRSAPYNALLIEVGVGLACDYDKRYLRSIASPLGSDENRAYFDVTDYGGILAIAEEIFPPLCSFENTVSECGRDCHGFCGCGQCLCPSCDESTDVCHLIKCNVSGGFSNGCVVLDEKYEIEDDACTSWLCTEEGEVDEETGKKGEWYYVNETCDAVRSANLGACRKVYCDVEFGGCRVEVDSSYCQLEMAQSPCEVWECVPLGEEPEDTTTGCRMIEDYRAECENSVPQEALTENGGCINVVCPESGSSFNCADMIVDTCEADNNACVTFKCTDKLDGTFGCVGTPTAVHEPTPCVEWECDNTDGWFIKTERNEEFCHDAFNGELSCKDFFCNEELVDGDANFVIKDEMQSVGKGGCTFSERDPKYCSIVCEETQEEPCKAHITEGHENIKQCTYDYCVIVKESETQSTPTCASDIEELNQVPVDCLNPDSPSAKKAKELNEANPNNCYSPVCMGGKCGWAPVEKPTDKHSDACMVLKCLQTTSDDQVAGLLAGEWYWDLVPTDQNPLAENSKCVSDECFHRTCDPNVGCVPEEICAVKTNDCYSYKCRKTDDNTKTNGVTCEETDLTKNFIHPDENDKDQCLYEVCEMGKDGILHKVTYHPECKSDNKCEKGTCVSGHCKWKSTIPDDVDVCLEYSCDPNVGEWVTKKRCIDNSYCTQDECWNYGGFYECHNEPIDCSSELEMAGYDCFMPYCKENPEAKTHRCVRKLLPNAFVDICGNCILDNPFETDSQSHSEDTLTVCTNSVPKPLMVEGLAAASIALIIVGAIVIGASITASGVFGTKTLIKYVKEASDQTAHSNPLYEGAENELVNPTYGSGQ